MASCAVVGGCPSDFIAIAFSLLCTILCNIRYLSNGWLFYFVLLITRNLKWLVSRLVIPCVLHKIPNFKGSGFWIPLIQVFASLNLLMSIVMSVNFLKFERRHGWQSCYVWAVWIEGPLGFGLLLSCRIAQAFKLFFVFVKKRLPAIRSFFFLPMILLPWVAGAAFIHIKKPLNYRCHMGAPWIIPILSLHSIYVATLVAFTMAVRHIEFRFDELRDLWKGILVSASSIGIWVSAYILNEIHEEIPNLQVVSRFLLLVSASILVLVLYSISSSEPLLSQVSLRRNLSLEQETMSKALGIPDSELSSQNQSVLLLDPNEPLDRILLNTKFRQSFMAFADSCLAGESVHFYDEVDELGKLPVDDTVRRIYMARHIIDKYIISGSPMEVNISHRSRLEIMKTTNLADPNLFDNAVNELMHLMKTNLAKDFWSSMFFAKLKEEAGKKLEGYELEQVTGWNLSPRPSSVQGKDDPFNQDSLNKEQLLL